MNSDRFDDNGNRRRTIPPVQPDCLKCGAAFDLHDEQREGKPGVLLQSGWHFYEPNFNSLIGKLRHLQAKHQFNRDFAKIYAAGLAKMAYMMNTPETLKALWYSLETMDREED